MRKPVLVSGLINIETTLQVDRFPLEYTPVRFPFFGVNTTVAGVGYNTAKALRVLGDPVRLLSLVGSDFAGETAIKTVRSAGLPTEGVLQTLEHTAQSVILYDSSGQRAINTDLKDIQERAYPVEKFDAYLQDCALAVLCNINFSRPFLKSARQYGKLVATDVHTISSLDDEYNRDFMEAADILFMSDERLPCPPEEWLRLVMDRYGTEIAVVGLGAKGACMAVRGEGHITRLPAAHTRPVVSTIGAGDALFSAFIHYFHFSGDPHEALSKAILFASYKIGEKGAADGFLDEEQLDRYYEERRSPNRE